MSYSKRTLCKAVSCILLSIGSFSCIDDAYDLDNVDTNVRVQVNDLTVPLNLDEMTLDFILDYDFDSPDSKIKIIDGVYTFVVDGDFSTSNIHIDAIEMANPDIKPAYATFENIPGLGSMAFQLTEPIMSTFDYQSGGIDASIKSIEAIGTDWVLSIAIGVTSNTAQISGYTITDLVLQCPKGLTGKPDKGTYNSETGLVTIPKLVGSGKSAIVKFPITKVDLAKAGGSFDANAHTIKFYNEVGIISGMVDVDKTNDTLLDQIEVSISTNPERLVVNSFTGSFTYDIEDFNIPQINLGNIPNVIGQAGTNIVLENPQLYLALTNPLSEYGVEAQTGLELTAHRGATASKPMSPDNGIIEIGTNGVNGFYNLCLYGKAPNSHPSYPSAVNAPFTDLRNIVSGEGIPTAISVNVLNPQTKPNTRVVDLMLKDYGKITGKYTFYAPLQFAGGSTIVYSSIDDKWDDEDLQDVVVTSLELTANVTNELPISLDVIAEPIDVNGNIMPCQIEGGKVDANAKDQVVKLRLTGTVSKLDGIKVSATAKTSENSAPLSDDMAIKFSELKIKVSGYYDTEL